MVRTCRGLRAPGCATVARAWGASALVTRNGRDFEAASLAVLDPSELLAAALAAERSVEDRDRGRGEEKGLGLG